MNHTRRLGNDRAVGRGGGEDLADKNTYEAMWKPEKNERIDERKKERKERESCVDQEDTSRGYSWLNI